MMTGGCLCGKVQYQITGQLFDAKSCHCSQCRKAYSAQASVTARVNVSDFKWTSEEQYLTTFMKSAVFGYQFCQVCGTTLCTVLNGQVFQISLACLHDDPKIDLQHHIYVASKAKWEVMPDGVVQYAEDAP